MTNFRQYILLKAFSVKSGRVWFSILLHKLNPFLIGLLHRLVVRGGDGVVQILHVPPGQEIYGILKRAVDGFPLYIIFALRIAAQ
jgi:hypothetical protein